MSLRGGGDTSDDTGSAREAATVLGREVSRRDLLKALGVSALALGAGPLLEACGQLSSSTSGTSGSSGTIKIGYVSPLTGPDAGFGEPDPYILGLARSALKKGLTIGGKTYAVEIIEKDSQSVPNVSAQVTQQLINSEQVDLLLATSTPETVLAVSAAGEAAGVPNIGTVVPWEGWFFTPQKNPASPVPFNWSFLFSFGVPQFASAYEHLWTQVPTNNNVGVMWPNDTDGNAIRMSLGPLLKQAGYSIVDPGAYTDGSNDYSSQINEFKSRGCEIFNTFPIPPDFQTFWTQAIAAGYRPKIAQIAKTGLFPSQVTALPNGSGAYLASAVYWAPTWPYSSSLTGLTSKQISDGYEKTGKQWNQQLGASMALLDAGIAALKTSGNPKDKTAVAAALKTLTVQTPLGKLAWGQPSTGVPPFATSNVVATPIIGGQWVPGNTIGSPYQLDFVICENSTDPNVPVAAKLVPYPGS